MKVDATESKECKFHKKYSQNHSVLFLYVIWKLNKSPQYGYSIAKKVQDFTLGCKKISTVYSLLNKLEKLGFVKSSIELKNSRSRRVYSITPRGRSLFKKIKLKLTTSEIRLFLNDLIT